MTSKDVLVRIGQAVVVLFITFTLAFFLLSALPSDGVMARYSSPDLGLSLQEIQAIRDELGADEPLIVQYFAVLGGFLTGNFGYSIESGTPVSALMADALPTTITLAAIAFVLALIVAGAIATAAYFSRWNWLTTLIRSTPALMISLPSFWVGIILIQVVSFQLGWVPVIEPTPAQAFILPALTLIVPISAPLAQVLIRAVDEAKNAPYTHTVVARGASRSWVFFRNIMRNALLPAVTMAGLLFGELVGGAVVTEAVFGLQGVGSLTVDAVAYRDTPVLLAVVVFAATTYVIINLIVDLLYPVIDPRLRATKKTAAAAPAAVKTTQEVQA
ncbi:ABC transporter permease [Corynebacterium renale]|uniref:Peptide/nickel transport system permease protein n=1 Tax=Corynebacterium renale TaxID=1724 RepID=A0A2A9DQB8_9CORY|nr:ABC transporter permease [Corynebacterium renale]PFG28172.1 peptide/nickel transport system permease protein [Corynebacterium renale]SQI20200.1 transporter [Corynebacterium renale]